jgi:hypothetical protein
VGDQSPRRERPVATLRTKCRSRWLRNLRLLSTGRGGHLDPRWAFCQYPDDLGFHPSMQVRRLFSGEDWCRRTGARSEERGQRGALATTPRRRDELARHHTPPFRPATVRLALSTRTEPHPASDPHAGTTTVPAARVTISGGSSTSAAEGALSGRARQTTRASNATPRLRRPTRVTVAVTSTTSPA